MENDISNQLDECVLQIEEACALLANAEKQVGGVVPRIQAPEGENWEAQRDRIRGEVERELEEHEARIEDVMLRTQRDRERTQRIEILLAELQQQFVERAPALKDSESSRGTARSRDQHGRDSNMEAPSQTLRSGPDQSRYSGSTNLKENTSLSRVSFKFNQRTFSAVEKGSWEQGSSPVGEMLSSAGNDQCNLEEHVAGRSDTAAPDGHESATLSSQMRLNSNEFWNEVGQLQRKSYWDAET
eukprot:CAMPEP_0185848204 /NCGR_PEP_ID=MMETSP1354-20130828/3180_1 /TAXON_ID=708628 /ORGANISM="Erythrolobus madagascarensis, Strain CCMP3276" /LENGTH=242 /DNA_ID=CAMNT_0028548577 /DNA_START=403 /DNA_END=1131 /DNA_ORIENTATION=-